MNLIAAAISIAALISSVSAAIVFVQPTSGSYWYTKTPNYINLQSNNPEEKFATIRFSSCNQCFSLPVTTNTTIPIVLPRFIRRNNILNLYAISDQYNTAYTTVNVIDTLCATAGDSCYDKPACGRRGGCGLYAESSAEAQQEANKAESELVYIAYESAEAKTLLSAQEQAVADLAADLLASEQSNSTA